MSSPRLQIELPHNASEIDWKTLGNMLSAHILGEVLQASYVDYKYGRKTSEFEAATDWEFFYEEHDVMVFRKRFSDSPIYAWMGRCVIDLPMEDVAKFVSNLETRKYWDKYLSEIRVDRQISDTDFIFYLHLVATQCLVKQHRDFTYYERIGYVEGKYVMSALSIDLPEFPRVSRITRAQILPGTGWVLEPYESNKTLINFLAHTDLKNLPPLIINRAARRSPMTVYHIREFLTNPVYRAKYEKAPPVERTTTDTFTESDLAYLNEQNSRQETLQANSAQLYQRQFLADQQLSVRDFLRNRPSLRRNNSEPFNLASSYDDDDESIKRRLHSHDGESMDRDIDEYVEHVGSSFDDSQSTPKAVHHSALDPPTSGLHIDSSLWKSNERKPDLLKKPNSDQTSNESNVETKQDDDEVLSQYTAPKTNTSELPFLTPQASEDEASLPASLYESPLNSPDNLSIDMDPTPNLDVSDDTEHALLPEPSPEVSNGPSPEVSNGPSPEVSNGPSPEVSNGLESHENPNNSLDHQGTK